MGVAMGGKGGAKAPLYFEIFSKKICFFSFQWEKTNFTTFGPPGQILEKSPSGTPGKNPSDAHACLSACASH